MTGRARPALRGGALDADGRTEPVVTGLAVLLAAGVGAVTFDVPGLVAGAALAAAWLVTPAVVVLALGQLLFAALLPADAALATVALVEAPLFLLFVGSVLDPRAPLTTTALGAGTLALLAGVVVAGVATLDALWQTGAVLVAVAAFAGYALHRYTVAAMEVTDEF